jgi:SAM-dependent methyltransferase
VNRRHSMLDLTDCPACAMQTLHSALWIKNGCQILKCEECGLGSATASSFSPSSYYTRAYFEGRHPDGYADYIGSEPVIRDEFRGIVNRLREVIPTGKLFEIGSAYGFFLMEAQPYYQAHGVEIAEDAAAFARARGLDVQSGAATRQTFEEIGPVDVVVMLDVIEHLENPASVLQLCAEYLRPDGVIFVTTGDFGSLFAKLSGKRWRLMTPPQHLWYFTKYSISKMAERYGFALEHFVHPWKKVPASLILYQIGRMSGISLSTEGLSVFNHIGLPINLFDAMSLILRKSSNA